MLFRLSPAIKAPPDHYHTSANYGTPGITPSSKRVPGVQFRVTREYDQIAPYTETTLAPLMAGRKDNGHQALVFDVCMHYGFVGCVHRTMIGR